MRFAVFAALAAMMASGALPASARDAAAGSWTKTASLESCAPPSMSCIARSNHTATMLANGKVLVAGGQGVPPAPVSAELYDPGKATWSPTGSMTVAFSSHTATLLGNGKVLLVGGDGNSELYDPASGKWSSTPRGRIHGEHTATLLRNGKVLIAGGTAAPAHLGTTTSDLYEPATNTWSPTGSMISIRYRHAAALLRDGRVLVVGGYSDNYGPKRDTAELYDPETGTWAPTGRISTTPIDATATVLTSGKVLLVGGESEAGKNSGVGGDTAAQLYDPASGSWAATAPMAVGRSLHTATLLPTGQVLVVGGERAGTGPEAELYDPTEGTWTPVPSGEPGLLAATATLIPPDSPNCSSACGNVLVVGGRSLIPRPAATLLYTPVRSPAKRPTSTAAGKEPTSVPKVVEVSKDSGDGPPWVLVPGALFLAGLGFVSFRYVRGRNGKG